MEGADAGGGDALPGGLVLVGWWGWRGGGRTLSCGMEGTRRWVVCRWEEKVRDLTWERRMASLGFGLAAVVRGARRRRRGRRRVCVGGCILVRSRWRVDSIVGVGRAQSRSGGGVVV